MRGEKGKLVCVWSPILQGEGCSTLACSIGIGLHHQSDKKVLIVNKSDSICSMERFVEKDIEIKYSMDNLKIFNSGIRADHILAYATQINTDLYMIAGARFDKRITGESKEFERLFIERCLEGFELVIVDVGKGTSVENKLYLDIADNIISVITPNEIAVDQLFKDSSMQTELDYFTNKKTVNIINKLYNDWEIGSVVSRYKRKYSLCKTFGLNYNGDLLNACCTDRKFYSFFMKKLKGIKSDYMQQLNEICSFIANELSIEKKVNESVKQGSLPKMFRKISIY